MNYFILSYTGGHSGKAHKNYKLKTWLRANGNLVVAIFKITLKN